MPGNDHSFTLNESALKKILLDRKVKNNKVIVLSIVGAYRTGKSFLLNLILRHLYSKVSAHCVSQSASLSASDCLHHIVVSLNVSVALSQSLWRRLVEWWSSVPSVRKVAGSTPLFAATVGPWASPSLVVAL